MDLVDWSLFFNLLSLISILIVLHLFYVAQKYKFFEFRLILYLQLSDLVLAVSYIIIVFTAHKEDDGTLCQIHSFLENSGNLSSVFFTMTISIVLFLTLRFNFYNSHRFELFFILFNFGFPSIMNLM